MKIISSFRQLHLIYHTIKPLKLRQIYSFIALLLKTYFFKTLIVRKVEKSGYKDPPAVLQLIPKPYPDCTLDLSNTTFTFLNQRIHFENQIDWNKSDLDKLWLYHLHYFDYLIQLTAEISKQNFTIARKITNDWIANNAIGSGNGWEPYPISLRVVNWIYFYYFYYQFFEGDEDFKNRFINSLYQQCHYLTYFLEYHLLANHLFKNGKALFIAGLFFYQHQWLKKGYRILEKELNRQILSDGGHFERSAMYHSIILEDILDLVNFMRGFQIDLLLVTFPQLQQKVKSMLKWLENMIHPDGEIALFGDAALKTVPGYEELAHYYSILFGEEYAEQLSAAFVPLKTSGYYIFRSEEQFLVIDSGSLGPAYQPGHAHCDLLSYEYSFAGCRFIIDSGIGDYLPSELRQKARGIYGHNTVVVNDLDQAQIWQAFRMGRRVYPRNAVYREMDNEIHFVANYDNVLNKSKRYNHLRNVSFINKRFFYFEDSIKAKKLTSLESLIHIHPECDTKFDHGIISLSRDGKHIAVLYDATSSQVQIRDWFYVPEFEKVIDAKVIVLQPKVENGKLISYIISPLSYLQQAQTFYSTRLKSKDKRLKIRG
jgi:uncharacterized heparinase superfamily protein